MKNITRLILLLTFLMIFYPENVLAEEKPELLSASGRISEDLILLQLRWTSSEMSNIKGFKVYLKRQAKSEFDMISNISINNGSLNKNGDTLTVSIGAPKGTYTFGFYDIYVSSVDHYNNERSSNILELEITDSQRDIVYFTSDLPENCYLGEELNAIITAESNSDNKVLYKTIDVPIGFSIDKNSGKISWIPNNSGYINITLEAYLESKPDIYVRNTWTVNVLKCRNPGSLVVSLVDTDGNPFEGGTCELYEYRLDSLVQVAEGNVDSSGNCHIGELDEREYLLYLNGTEIMEKIFISEWYNDSRYIEFAEPVIVNCGKQTSIVANLIRYPKFDEYEISGLVLDDFGNPIKNTIVRFYGSSMITDESFISNAMVDSLGKYSIILSSEYEYFAYCFTYLNDDDELLISQYYKDASNVMEARKLHLTRNLNDINFTIDSPLLTDNTLFGSVKDTYDKPISFANVSAFKIDDYENNYPCRSVSTAIDGSFTFNNLQSGKYILFTVPLRNNYIIPTYLSTENYPELIWENAQIINIVESNQHGPFDIIVDRAGISLGKSVIEGYVFDIGGVIKESHNPLLNSEPINGANLYLIEEGMNTIKYTNTDEEGAFNFANVGNGTYRLIVDKVGYATYIKDFGNIYEGSFITENIFLSDEMASRVKYNSNIITARIKVTPNPASNSISVALLDEGNIEQVTICNIQGFELIRTQKISGKEAFLNVSGLCNGIYYIVVRSNGKFLKVPVCILN